MNKGKASGVSWVKPAEPSFLKKFKTDVGYKEGPNVDTKRQAMPTPDDDSGSDREDELPQVVVLKSGDLSADEVKKLKGELRAEGESEKAPDGKILFKKPAKRLSSDKFQGITASSSKKKKEDRAEQEEDKDRKSGKKVKNNSLLSFGDDEEEEND
uniref:Zgc:77056 n=1 Tax=Poecilia reticulata TaxID=8081 RepID=A0A3P9P4B3_POERE